MKLSLAVVGVILMIIAAFATPVAIIYGIYEWVVVDVAFKVALWEAAKTWLGMVACVIPGWILYAIGITD